MTRWGIPFVIMAGLLVGGHAVGREWKSGDGTRTIQARFAGVRGDQLMLSLPKENAKPFPLSAFSEADRKFATTAQAIADAAAKWGPQSFEVSQALEGGCLCRLALAPASKSAPTLFSGEMFFLLGTESGKLEQGAQLSGRLLFGAGGRTFHPLKGEPLRIRAFALDIEEATQAWMDTVGSGSADPARQSPPVVEPEIEVVTTRGFAVAVSKAGLFVTDASLTQDADTLLVQLGGEAHPAKVVKFDEKLGLALVSCPLNAEPPRLGTKKPAELGQSVYAVSLELNGTKRALASEPAVSHGVVSRLGDAKVSTFEHDTKVPLESVGGFLVGMKGEALGVFFRSQSTTRALTSKKSKAAPVQDSPFGSCVSTAALAAFLDGVAGIPALRTAPTETDVGIVAKGLMKGTALVIATRNVQKPREILASSKSKAPSGFAPPAPNASATGWSLSKSGTRHNAKCRFFDANLPCAASDGKPCKVCGG